ncbi:MAG: cation:proton antiporter [candidate division Zixibacteria bacterium]|nr:cation:proton antiporter [candidate division Zixibacteria bacterium]
MFEATARAVAIIVGVLFLARLVVPRALHLVALTRQRHLFVLSVLLVCIGTAWIVSSAGVSLALGAFLAGLVVAGSEYRHQAFADLISFRDVFTSVFFVSIGMMLDLSLVADSIVKILLLLSAVMIGKFMIVFLSAIIMRLPLRVAVLSSAALSQIGEFSFILAFAAVGTGLFVEPLASEIIAVAIISMLITPFILALAPHLAAGASKMPLLSRLVRAKSLADISKKIDSLSGHVIIGGYGFAGMELANALRACDVPYVIAELNPENIRRAIKFNEPAYYGDVTSAEELERLGAARASELVLVINDPGAVERAVVAAKSINPQLHIVVRTRYLLDIAPLLTVGANEVVPAELEAAAEVVSRILRRHGVADDRLLRQSKRIHSVIREQESE